VSRGDEVTPWVTTISTQLPLAVPLWLLLRQVVQPVSRTVALLRSVELACEVRKPLTRLFRIECDLIQSIEHVR
jgi:hypothetical protein